MWQCNCCWCIELLSTQVERSDSYILEMISSFTCVHTHAHTLTPAADTCLGAGAVASAAAVDWEASPVLLHLPSRGEGADGVSQEQSAHVATTGPPGSGEWV